MRHEFNNGGSAGHLIHSSSLLASSGQLTGQIEGGNAVLLATDLSGTEDPVIRTRLPVCPTFVLAAAVVIKMLESGD